MRYQTKTSDNIIRGSCSLFVCRCCRTKFGWAHQEWCDVGDLTEPTCCDCRYFSERHHVCLHVGYKKERRHLPHEKDQRPL